jgi:hypothetical protein
MGYDQHHIASIDLQTKIDIYQDLPTRFQGSENKNFVQGLAINMENYVDSTITAPARHWIQAYKIIIFGEIIHDGRFV